MNIVRPASLVLAAALVLRATCTMAQLTAAGGTLDHLLCFTVNDKLKPGASVDLKTELQPEFSRAGCRVVKPTKFCVPTTKVVTTAGSVGPNIVGQPLRDDYICYLVKCPNDAPIPFKLVADQFGQRRQEKFRPFELCVPARKDAPPCVQIGGGKQCGGVCPDDAAGNATACRYDDTLNQCTCVPDVCDGKPDKNGQCGGACPTVGQFCRPGLDAAGKPACLCKDPPPPPCGLNPATGTCGGACPNPADACVQIMTSPTAPPICTCQPPVPSCQEGTGALCAGPCPVGLTCVHNTVTNKCRCEPPPQNCGANPTTGQCGGLCPANQICRFITVAGATPQCTCVTP
ncbi:MAG: hypothetical protein SF182_14070 [Deltaproteobacteria bacterium]|nr:hypothetical protein [Deltaproteobacteria bacterium]